MIFLLLFGVCLIITYVSYFLTLNFLRDIGCNFFDFISWLDLVHFCYFFALLFFFIFLRQEFKRNKEDAIWTIIRQQQVSHKYSDINNLKDPQMTFKNFE